jgi:lipopolysaccharide export system permease protein
MHHSSQGMFKNNILSKSFNLEVFKSSIAILTIFFLLVVGSRFVSYFEQASEGNLDPSIIFYAVFLRFPDFISLLIPLSFFLGILITVSRLYADREIYAYFSTGIAPINLAKFIFPQALTFALCAFLLSFYLAPSGKEISNDLLKIDTFEEQILSLEPGEIYLFKNSSGFITSEGREGLNLNNVIFFNQLNEDSLLISSSSLNIEKLGEEYDLSFEKGTMNSNLFSKDDRIFSTFGIFNFRINEQSSTTGQVLGDYFNNQNTTLSSEFQWSLSFSMAIFILMFMAVYLGKVEPRKGRLSVILPGMFIYILYFSLLLLGKDYVSQNINTNFNLGLIHLVFGLFALVLFLRDKYFMLIPSRGILSFQSLLIILLILYMILMGVIL